MSPLPIQVDALGPASPQLRLAFVTETYPPEVNGVAVTLARIVREMQARNHHISLVRPRLANQAEPGPADALFEEVLTRGVALPFYKQLRMGLPAKQDLLNLWSRRRPDLVHIATEGPLGWSALQAARKLRIPVSTDFRTNFHAYSHHYKLGWLKGAIVAYLRRFHNAAQVTMVPTPALARDLATLGFERLEVVPRGVDAGRFSPGFRSDALRAHWGAGPGDKVLLNVGRLAQEKNLDLVVQAYEHARRRHPVKLVLVGDGPLAGALAQRCPGAFFAGFRSGDDLAAHYASADLFLFPSQTETFGNVVVEALASGLPVVSFDLAAASELITDREQGRLFHPADTRGFVGATNEILGVEGLLPAMAQRARAIAEQQSWSAIAERTERIMLGALYRSEAWPAPAWAV